MSLCDDRNPIFRSIVGVEFAFWVNGPLSSLGSVGRPWVRMSLVPDGLVQRHRKQDHTEMKWAPSESERTVEFSLTLIRRG